MTVRRIRNFDYFLSSKLRELCVECNICLAVVINILWCNKCIVCEKGVSSWRLVTSVSILRVLENQAEKFRQDYINFISIWRKTFIIYILQHWMTLCVKSSNKKCSFTKLWCKTEALGNGLLPLPVLTAQWKHLTRFAHVWLFGFKFCRASRAQLGLLNPF